MENFFGHGALMSLDNEGGFSSFGSGSMWWLHAQLGRCIRGGMMDLGASFKACTALPA